MNAGHAWHLRVYDLRYDGTLLLERWHGVCRKGTSPAFRLGLGVQTTRTRRNDSSNPQQRANYTTMPQPDECKSTPDHIPVRLQSIQQAHRHMHRHYSTEESSRVRRRCLHTITSANSTFRLCTSPHHQSCTAPSIGRLQSQHSSIMESRFGLRAPLAANPAHPAQADHPRAPWFRCWAFS